MDAEPFDLGEWMKEHGHDSIPVPVNFFITPVLDAASGGDFLVVGFATITTDSGTAETITQSFALTETFAALIVANLERRVPNDKLAAARAIVAAADARAKEEGWWDENPSPFPVVPPSAEVIDQMIHDDTDPWKKGL